MAQSAKYDICIVGGCGHVGLPLGIALADQGKRVALYDINKKSVDLVNKKQMPFKEEAAPEKLAEVIDEGALRATLDAKTVASSETVIMVIGTPVDEYLNPKHHEVMRAIKDILPHLNDKQLLILRSTLYPGVTDKINEFLKKHGVNMDVAFCPERIAEGHALTELYSLPQIVAGCSKRAEKRASELFSLLSDRIIGLQPVEAELAKLFTNTWRYINFAISNQFYTIAGAHDIDFYHIYDAMTEDYPRLKSFAKAGFAAGPCLFKDTMQLSAFSGNNFFLGHAAMLINEGLPEFVLKRLKYNFDDLHDKKIALLGMAFKGESDDPRESLSYKLKKILEFESKEVLCSDEYIEDEAFVPAEEAIDQADIIVVATPHNKYRALDYQGKKVYDMWNLASEEALVEAKDRII